MKTRVLIVDDEPIARRGIRRYLAKHNDIEVVGEAANGISAVEQINESIPTSFFSMCRCLIWMVLESSKMWSHRPAPLPFMSSSRLTMRTPFVHSKCTLLIIS